MGIGVFFFFFFFFFFCLQSSLDTSKRDVVVDVEAVLHEDGTRNDTTLAVANKVEPVGEVLGVAGDEVLHCSSNVIHLLPEVFRGEETVVHLEGVCLLPGWYFWT